MFGGASSFFVNSVAMKRAGRGIAPLIRRGIAGGAISSRHACLWPLNGCDQKKGGSDLYDT